MLDELDREAEKDDRWIEKKVAKVRIKMRVGRNQPIIMSKMKGVVRKQVQGAVPKQTPGQGVHSLEESRHASQMVMMC